MVRKLKKTYKAKYERAEKRLAKKRKTVRRKPKKAPKRRTKAYRPRNGKPKAFKYVLRAGKLRYAGKA